MRIFIAGIMQGSRRDNGVDDQGYRQRIASTIRAWMPDAEIIDPWAMHPDSPAYADDLAKPVFMSLNDAAATADVLVAFVPQASMGTAIEMWQAFKAGARVLTISPLAENWVVKFLSDRVFGTLEEFEQFAAQGGLEGLVSASSV